MHQPPEDPAHVYYAHTREGSPKEEWEPLDKHLEAVASLAGQFAESISATELARLAGLWHDLGKYSEAFQDFLRNAGGADGHPEQKLPRVDHSTAGAQHAVKRCSKPTGRIIAYCIAGHHGGLPDAKDTETGGQSGLNDRLKKPIPSFDGAPSELLKSPCLRPPALHWGKNGADCSFRLSVFCRMLFSCLVDADFLATEQFMNPERADKRPADSPSLTDLLAHLNVYLADLEARCTTTPVNTRRQEVLGACRKKAALPPGLFSLTVPTGGGKTLSSLAFALTHAKKHELRRVIYAIPFTSIIEQTAKVFRDALSAADPNVVLEHHSNFERTKNTLRSDDDQEDYWDSLAAENWDAPLIVTTNVQLFESLFASKPSRCRKLHRIAQSVIILDEVQTLPVDLLRPTLAMLDELCRNYGCSVVLCSATQPAVGLRDGFKIGLPEVREIIDDAPALFSIMKRVHVNRIGLIDNTELVARLAGHDRVLCVVNTRAHAADVLQALKTERADNVFHLSASMCAAHRTDVLDRIRARLNPSDPRPCVVVSTQLIEAGVDIDFPVVYRAMTGIDSIAQAAGRCNREGRWDLGQVFVFDTDVKPPRSLLNSLQFGNEVASQHDELVGLEVVEQYFELLYWSREDEWDKHEIMKCFSYSKRGLHAQFREAASKYRLIRDDQHSVIVPYGDQGTALIEELESMREPPGRDFSRRAQRFSVGVYPWDLEKLRTATLVTTYHERFWILDRAAYDEELGVRPDVTGRDPDSLIV